jgi:hypothetical protein
MPRGPAAHAADREQNSERGDKQDDGHGGRAGDVVALDLPEDVDGRDLGLERLVARDQDDGAELTERAGESQRLPDRIAGNRLGRRRA